MLYMLGASESFSSGNIRQGLSQTFQGMEVGIDKNPGESDPSRGRFCNHWKQKVEREISFTGIDVALEPCMRKKRVNISCEYLTCVGQIRFARETAIALITR